MALDVIIVVLLSYGLVTGFKKGLVGQLFVIVALILGIFFASGFYLSGAEALKDIITNPIMAKLVSFILIFAAVAVTLAVIAFFIRKAMQALLLGWADRLLGALFGLLKASLIITIILIFLITAPVPFFNRLVEQSALTTYFLFTVRAISYLLPFEFAIGVREWLFR